MAKKTTTKPPAERSPRTPGDRYDTDGALTAAVVPLLGIQPGQTVLEPHVGGGAWVAPLLAAGAEVHVRDIDPQAQGLRLPGVVAAGVEDFLEGPAPVSPVFDWVVGNPPFDRFDEHLCRALCVGRRVAFLCRITWLMGASRVPVLAEMPPRLVLALSPRPSFTGDGSSDMAPAVVAVWEVGEVWETRWQPVLWRRTQAARVAEVDAGLGLARRAWRRAAGEPELDDRQEACRAELRAAVARHPGATCEVRGRLRRCLEALAWVGQLSRDEADAVAASVWP